MLMLTAFLTVPAFAITEAEVEAQVNATSRETVTGNVLIWFLCAVAFLKVSQKVDSFMATLGVNVGHTGGSMLAEAMLATRGVAAVAGFAGRSFGGGRSGAAGRAAGGSGSTGSWFLKGGLAGVVNRKVTSDAVRTATTATSAVNTAKSTTATDVRTAAASEHDSSHVRQSDVQTDTQHIADNSQIHFQSMMEQSDAQAIQHSEQVMDQSVHQAEQSTRHTDTHTHETATHSKGTSGAMPFKGIGLGGALFAQSLSSGGKFATDVIGTVAKGDIRTTGSITGDLAAQAVMPYLGCSATGENGQGPLSFSNVEIGGGRITGMVQSPGHPEPVAFGLYHAEQYTEPKSAFTKFQSVDGTLWYAQSAQNTVERTPYKAADGSVAYHEELVKKLPDPPNRKDRI